MQSCSFTVQDYSKQVPTSLLLSVGCLQSARIIHDLFVEIQIMKMLLQPGPEKLQAHLSLLLQVTRSWWNIVNKPLSCSLFLCCSTSWTSLQAVRLWPLYLITSKLFHFSSQEAGRFRGSVDHGGGDVSSLPPLVSFLHSSPSIPPVCRALLQTEKPTERSGGRTNGRHELPVSEAVELLRDAEELLLQRRERRRLVNRRKLQEAIGRLDQLLLIPL